MRRSVNKRFMRSQTVLWNFPSNLQGDSSRQPTVDYPYSETARHVRAGPSIGACASRLRLPKRYKLGEKTHGLETAFRRTDPAAPRTPACHPRGRWQIYSKATEGRTADRGVADRGRNIDPGR